MFWCAATSWINKEISEKLTQSVSAQPTHRNSAAAHFSGYQVGSITKTGEIWFYDPIRHTCTPRKPTGLLDERRTHATSDGHPCCEMGRISTCFQMLTERDHHLESQRLCWFTIRWGRQWFNRKINWLCSSTWRLRKANKVTLKK